MSIDFPDLDPRDEEALVAEVIDDLPAELSDRNRWTPEVKLIEACGAFYAGVLFYLNQWPERLQLAVLNLLGLSPRAAEAAVVTLTFTRTTSVGALTIPAGTIAKTGVGVDAVKFETDVDLLIPDGQLSADVAATASVPGAVGNVVPGSVTRLDQPITGVASVINAQSAAGGLDEEPVAALIARAPLAMRSQERAITAEDFVYHALNVNGVLRGIASGSAGSVAVFILTQDLNEVTNAPLIADVQTELLARTTPGVGVTVIQSTLRLVAFPSIELKLRPGFSLAAVTEAARLALSQAITALPLYAADGYTVEHEAWPYGAQLYLNEVISLLDRVEGVDRVGLIRYEASDDYGGSWTPQAILNVLDPGRGGLDDLNFGLLHFDASRPLNVTVLP